MSAELAVEDLASRKPVSAAELRTFLDAASSSCSLQVLSQVGAATSKRIADPSFIKIASTFSWDDVGEALLDVLGTQSLSSSYGEDSALEMLLRVAAGLNDGVPRQACSLKLWKKSKKRKWSLHSSTAAEVLWKHAICLGDLQSSICDFNSTSEQFALLSKIAAKRVEWLEGDIHKLDKLSKTFSWERCHTRTATIEGDGASVTITKIRQWYEDSQAKLARYTEEMANLSKVYRSVDMISTNKPRLELETRIGGLT
ncbi:unnamed protein product [Peronospora farinosa]|uniref:Uncharacterized protein n=1 Tax=Peronospora farinosa TaxID=134698 RepID=A0ABN8CCS9_9STRA|nr:unnamed protein product [Peronospora farinosa]